MIGDALMQTAVVKLVYDGRGPVGLSVPASLK